MFSENSLLQELEDIEDNKDNLRRLTDQLLTPIGIIPFVGAGLSMPFGFPSWSDFLITQAKKAGIERKITRRLAKGEYEEAAEDLLEARGRRAFVDAIGNVFGPHQMESKKLKGAVSLLPQLASGPVITTNFDTVLEQVFKQAGVPFEREIWGANADISTEALIQQKRFLIKIHGDAQDSENRVLTRSDYARYYGSSDGSSVNFTLPLPGLLRRMLLGRALLFLGCSLNQDRTIGVLRDVSKSDSSIAHYAIVEQPASEKRFHERSRLLSEHNIRPIWYPNGHHDVIEPLLAHLLGKAIPGAQSPANDSHKASTGEKQEPDGKSAGGRASASPVAFTMNDAIAEKKSLHPQVDPEIAEPKFRHNLPNAEYGQFIGRQVEIAHIHKILRPYPHSQHSLVTIDGIGGIGKSTLALEVAYHYYRKYHELPREERFDAIIWMSAKQTVLTEQGIQSRPQAFRTLEDLYATIAITLERQDITKASAQEQLEIVRNALTQQRTLLIVDNLETVDDEKVITFLRELPAPTKAIITTRHRIDVAYPIRLKGMEEREARQLIQQECEKRNHVLSESDSERLYRYTDGVPLAIVWSIAQMSAGHSTGIVLERLGDAHGDIAKFCFDGVINGIRSTSAFEVLLALSIFQVDASREALGFVADLAEIDRDDSLVLLEKLSLVNKHTDRFNMLPLTKDYTSSILMKDDEKLMTLRFRQHRYYLKKLKTYSDERRAGDALQTMERRRFRELETTNILNHVDWCVSARETEDVPYLIRGVLGYLWAVGHWTLCHKYAETALKLSQQRDVPNLEMEAYLLFRMSRIALMRGDNDAAEKGMLRALDLYRELDKVSRLAHVASYLGILYTNQNLYRQTEDNIVPILQQAREAGDKKAIARLQNVLGQAYLGLGKHDLAGGAVAEALSIYQNLTPSTGLAASYELLGRIKLVQDQPAEAAEYFNKCYSISKEVNVSWYSAFAKKWLAQAMIDLNDYESAVVSLTESIEIFKNTGMRDKLAEAESMLVDARKKISQT